MNVLVYTAVFGGYDSVKQHEPQRANAQYVYFNEENDGITYNPWRYAHPRYRAKYYKLWPYGLPHYNDFDYVIWLDGSARLTSPDSIDFLIASCVKGYAVFRHPNRDCIYDELIESEMMPKYASQRVRQQIEHYRQDGYPAHYGLYAIGANVRSTKKDYRLLDRNWLQENARWTYQDQISFPYVLWKHQISVDIIELPLWNNPYVSFDFTRPHQDR